MLSDTKKVRRTTRSTKSPVQRTIAELVKEGFGRKQISSVERFFPRDNPHAVEGDPPRKYDLFGFGDLLCYRCTGSVNRWLLSSGASLEIHHDITRLIQVCGPGQFQAHYRKITQVDWIADNARIWLQCGNEIQLWEWNPYKKEPRTGKSRVEWKPRIHAFTLEDFER